jgi:hypothetical protein
MKVGKNNNLLEYDNSFPKIPSFKQVIGELSKFQEKEEFQS